MKHKELFVNDTKLETINPNNLKLVYEDCLIAAYIELASESHMKEPLIICGGQFETYLHNLDMRNPKTAYAHTYSRIAKDLYTPVIIVPKYKSIGVSKEYANAITMDSFTESTSKAVDELGVDSYIMSGHSFGGFLTVKMSLDERFNRGVAIHPAIMGSVLANTPRLKKLAKERKLNGYEKPMGLVIRGVIDNRFGFIKEFAEGNSLEKLKVLGNWSKLSIIGGYMNPEETKGLLKYTSKMMTRIAQMENSCLKNDGFINWDELILNELGANYFKLENVNHFDVENEQYQIYAHNLLTYGRLRK